jgi:hypothetical protein
MLSGCDALGDAPRTPAPTPGETDRPLPTALPGGRSVDLARLGYVENLLVGVEAGSWSYDEGLELSVRATVGAANPRTVFGREGPRSLDLTSLVAAARERLGEGPPDEVASALTNSLRFLLFDRERLQAMTVKPGAPLPTSPGITPLPPPDPNDPHPEDKLFDPGAASFDLDCELFFRRFPVTPDTTTCLAARQASFAGFDYGVFAPVQSIAPFQWTAQHHAWVDEALADSVPRYLELGTLPDFDVVLAVNLDAPGEALTIDNGDECLIVLYTRMQRRHEPGFKQIVARQLAHCLQFATFEEPSEGTYADNRWRQEGLAAYLSNLVYPAADVEHELLETLRLVDDDSTLFDWSAAAFVWFQFMGERIGVDGLMDLLGTLPVGNRAEQAAALADFPGLGELYHAFALAYTDGAISDSSGELLPTDWRPGDSDGALVETTGRHAIVDVPTFAMRRTMVVVPPDRRAELAAGQPAGGIRTSARAYSGRSWGVLPTTFPERCLQDNRLLIVTTSTRDETYRRAIEVTAFDTSCG